MKNISILLMFLVFLTHSSTTYASDDIAFSQEQNAYERLLSFIVEIRNHEEHIQHSEWRKNLQFLISTSSLEGDRHLANLAFFGLDSALSEDFSCAVDRRLAKHKDTFIKVLKKSQEQFDQQNPCQIYNDHRADRAGFLHCRSKEDFSRFVTWWIAETERLDSSLEVDCSEMFE